MIYSTYLGGQSSDRGFGIAVDGSGNAYVSGFTEGSDFPTHNAYQLNQGDDDAFVTKLSPSGSSLIYSTYLGGGLREGSYGIAVDESGNAYVTGYTESGNFPTQNPLQMFQGSIDAFVTKLSNSGDSLIYSTYIGGGGYDYGLGNAVAFGGDVYVTGITSSSDFPTQNPYQLDQGDWDVFVAKLSNSGNNLIYSTYLGGESNDFGRGIAVDGSGYAYTTGVTWSSDFPTQNPYQTDQGFEDVFVTKLAAFELGICGDPDASGEIDIDDVVYLINYIFAGGSPPEPLESGDADCSGAIDIDDVVYLISYIFSGGNAPCDTDGDEVQDC